MSEDLDSCTYFMVIRGFHFYKEVWTGTLGKILQCRREMSNPCGPFAVAVAVVDNEDITPTSYIINPQYTTLMQNTS